MSKIFTHFTNRMICIGLALTIHRFCSNSTKEKRITSLIYGG
ncbi:MAG: hypothetical protein JWR18_3764 [Segetibacter sp.]|nr:hypothetical protein [Segetibacter sp.]